MTQPKTRSRAAILAHFRRAGVMDKRGKGRLKRDARTRQDVRASLRRDR